MERPDIRFNFKPTLKQLCSIRIAIDIWETPKAKSEVKNFFLNIDNPNLIPQKWMLIARNCMGILNSLNVSSELSADIQNMIIFIGERLFLYSLYMTEGQGFDVEYIQKLYWTANGSIDEVKIFRNVWQKDHRFPSHHYSSSELPSSLNNLVNKSALIYMAVFYAQEKFLKDSLNKIKEMLEAYALPNLRNINLTVHSAMAILLCFYIGNKRPVALELYKNLKKDSKYSNSADNLFFLCATSGLEYPAKYYYKKIKENDRPDLLMKTIEECLLKINRESSDIWLREKLLNMVEFLFNEMSNKHKLDFLIKNGYIGRLFEAFANSWPHQELCLPILNYISDALSGWEMKHLLYSTLDLLIKGAKFEYYARKKTHQKLLRNLLEKIPKGYKIRIFVGKKKYWYELFEVSDFTSMKIIITDPDLISHRKDIINNSIRFYQIFNYIASKGTFELIDQYMIELDFTEAEKDMFKANFGCYTLFDLVRTGRFDLADKLLNWRFPDSESQKINMKRMINSDIILPWFIRDKNYRLANDFLEWRFNSNEERELAKRRFLYEKLKFVIAKSFENKSN